MFRSFCLVTLMAASISQARGEFINGSIDFIINQKSPVGSISDAIMFADLESGTGSGGFATFESGVPWGNFTINAHDSSSQPLLITTEGFGTFSGAVTIDQLIPVGGSIFRNILVEGIFLPEITHSSTPSRAPTRLQFHCLCPVPGMQLPARRWLSACIRQCPSHLESLRLPRSPCSLEGGDCTESQIAGICRLKRRQSDH